MAEAGGTTPIPTKETGATADRSRLASRLLQKRDLLLRNDPAHEEIRTALVIGGGGMRGVYGGGVVTALEKLGLTDVFDELIGVSAGAADCAYFLSGQAEVGTSLYYEEFASRRFINPFRPLKIMDLSYLAEEVRTRKQLDIARIRASRSRLFVGVTNAETGECDFLDVRPDSIDIIDTIVASCALPGVSRSMPCINGTPYVDGVASCGLPVAFAIDALRCTDVLVVLNAPYADERSAPSLAERLLVAALARNLPHHIRRAFATRHLLYNDAATRIRQAAGTGSGINIGVIAPERIEVGNITTNPASLRRTAEQGARDAIRFFGLEEVIGAGPGCDATA